jgi:hypothetical protein
MPLFKIIFSGEIAEKQILNNSKIHFKRIFPAPEFFLFKIQRQKKISAGKQ